MGIAPAADVTPAEVHVVAKEAYLFGYPLVENYRVMYQQAIDQHSANYLAPFNRIRSMARMPAPDDGVPMSNLDTAFSFAWIDLRSEPVVLTLPAVEASRYISVQLIDLYTHNFDYLGSRTTGSAGGSFLLAGPGWKGDAPQGVRQVVRAETQLALAIIRTQVLGTADLGTVQNIADLGTVQNIQAGYRLQPLSEFLGKRPPKPAARISFPAPTKDMLATADFFRYLAFVLQFCPPHPTEADMRTRFGRVGIDPGKPFRTEALSAPMREAFLGGMADGRRQIDARRSLSPTAENLFGSRESLKNDYVARAAGAQLGLYGSSREEAIYPVYLSDADGDALDARRWDYVLRFPAGSLPPVDAFWSLTLYRLPGQLLTANPLARYRIDSAMLPDLKRDADGGLTIHVQYESPGAARESNWLPAPDGPFMLSLRLYLPKSEALDGRWSPPPVRKGR